MLSLDAPFLRKLSAESGIPIGTLSRWKHEAIRASSQLSQGPTMAKRPEDRSPEQKLALVIEAAGLSNEGLGAFLRRMGIHEAQLQQWRHEALGGLSDSTPAKSLRPSRRIRSLERELARKEKALAEAATLLLLKKKAHQLLGDVDDGTE